MALCVCRARHVEIWRETFVNAQVQILALPLCGTPAKTLPLSSLHLLTCKIGEEVCLTFLIVSDSLLVFVTQ